METAEPQRRLWSRIPASWRPPLLILAALVTIGGFYLLARFSSDVPVAYERADEHFKYGSTGGERSSGIPYAIWKALPRLFPEYLPGRRYVPGREYEGFGFIYEPGRDLPIGVSQRNYQGLPRVFLNCAICHVGSVRFRADAPRRIVLGMPSNTVDLQAFQRFLFDCAADEKYGSDRVMAEIARVDRLDAINRAALGWFGVAMMRERSLMLRQRFRYMDWEPDFGPGRVDTFTPAKVLLNFPLEKLPHAELAGTADFPSVWLQRPRRNMQLHWDGNNDSVEERNRSAAFGTGAFPPTLDRSSLKRVEDWLLDLEPPRFPEPIDQPKAALGEPLYARQCANCHGRSGRDFTGGAVGHVVPIGAIGTDRRRLDSYSYELSMAQYTIYAGYDDERFSHFRKTFGYANMPLDGVWLRAPYLHNGSVPTLRDLLEPAAQRPRLFYRGYDLYDPVRMGFVSEPRHFEPDGRSRIDAGDTRRYFRYAIACADDPKQCDRYPITCQGPDQGGTRERLVCGNGNGGHEYGTALSAAEKDALVEYLKTF